MLFLLLLFRNMGESGNRPQEAAEEYQTHAFWTRWKS